ncbi:Lnb N-terminal periplasmic domain-containing protein [Roseobacter sp. SK209-2-6]|uniref:Lnb N-terminal periplasmic domain-containing protein n=1 Tax=Roseobacter sp. SK209-2-6 TaxID=388739 RepID=UPI00055D46A2|nr:DUF4105 domain-containing protein [Roseobacter sp. SK209-2-6]
MTRHLRRLLLPFLALAMLLATSWASLALWYRLPFEPPFPGIFAGFFALFGSLTVIGLFRPRKLRALTTFCFAIAAVLTWWSSLTPPAERDWSPDVARQVTGTVEGSTLTLNNLRNFTWRSTSDFDQNWETRSYDLDQLESVDLVMSYWSGRSIAHMLISFGFANGDYIAWSVEVRRQQGGEFSPIADLFKANTLAIVAADERDVIGTRTNARGEDVQLFRTNTSPERARELLLQYVVAANSLAEHPRWYNSLTTNCTTVVMTMIRTIVDEVPLDWRVMANGYLPSYAYDAGVLNSQIPLEELIEVSRITKRAQSSGITAEFSAMIREGLPLP